MAPLTVSVVSRRGKQLGQFQLDAEATVQDLKTAFQKKNKCDPNRQYFTIGEGAEKKALKAFDSKLSEYGVKNGSELVFKDLGPQIGWQTVFFVEYFGPMLVHFIFFQFPSLFYTVPKGFKHGYAQQVAFALVIIHYAKRELETAFVHRFSSTTMPMFNIFKNSFHYWFLGGANIAYFVYHPKYTQAFSDDTVNIFAGVALLCMLGNFYCHYILMNLRPSGTTARGIPQGFLFNFVSCPNYFLEIIEWIAFAIMTQALTSYLFALVSAGQMWIWAVDKHKRYKKEFDGTKGTQKYPKRKILIPFVL